MRRPMSIWVVAFCYEGQVGAGLDGGAPTPPAMPMAWTPSSQKVAQRGYSAGSGKGNPARSARMSTVAACALKASLRTELRGAADAAQVSFADRPAHAVGGPVGHGGAVDEVGEVAIGGCGSGHAPQDYGHLLAGQGVIRPEQAGPVLALEDALLGAPGDRGVVPRSLLAVRIRR